MVCLCGHLRFGVEIARKLPGAPISSHYCTKQGPKHQHLTCSLHSRLIFQSTEQTTITNLFLVSAKPLINRLSVKIGAQKTFDQRKHVYLLFSINLGAANKQQVSNFGHKRSQLQLKNEPFVLWSF